MSAGAGLVMASVYGVFYLVATVRKGTVARFPVDRCPNVVEFRSPLAARAAFAEMVSNRSEFLLEDQDEARGLVLFTTKPTWDAWGFFYPVEVTDCADGGSRIRVGIVSRAVQVGPWVDKWQRKCVAQLRGVVAAPLPAAKLVSPPRLVLVSAPRDSIPPEPPRA